MKKILVAEDDKFLASAYKLKLSKSGYEVRLASDGAEAVKLLEEFTPDLILMDLVMPNKDGFAALAEIKANQAWKQIPVVIASNLGQKEDMERGKSMGAVDYVIKTEMTLVSLLEKIKSIIGE